MIKSQEALKFINFIIKDCQSEGVRIRFVKAKKIYDGGMATSGSFSDVQREIAVAIRCPLSHWLGVLVHEYAHFCQWRENAKAWRTSENASISDAGSLLVMWLQRDIELTEKQRQSYVNQTIALELDCEKRAVRLIKQFKLPIDLKEYIKKANAYLASYQAIAAFRKWNHPHSAAYLIDEIWMNMPENFTYPYFKKLSVPAAKQKFGKCFKG